MFAAFVLVCERQGAEGPGKHQGSPQTITIGPPRPLTDRPFQLDFAPFPRFALGGVVTTPHSVMPYIQPNSGAIGVSPPVLPSTGGLTPRRSPAWSRRQPLSVRMAAGRRSNESSMPPGSILTKALLPRQGRSLHSRVVSRRLAAVRRTAWAGAHSILRTAAKHSRISVVPEVRSSFLQGNKQAFTVKSPPPPA
jgi:hypothetical protein